MNENLEITKEELAHAIIDENLEEYCTIEYNSTDFTIENCVFFNNVGEKIIITASGERGTHTSKEFTDEKIACGYMLSKLRSKKRIAQRNEEKGYTYR